jgi:hypothetical protein
MRTILALTTTYCLLSNTPAYSYNSVDALSFYPLQSPIPKIQIATSELAFWDNVIQNMPDDIFAEKGGKTRLYAYLSNAQKSFANASLAITGSYTGSLDPVSLHIIRLFDPNYRPSSQTSADPFSQELAQEIIKEYQARFEEEQSRIYPYTVPDWNDMWQGTTPYIGLKIPSMKPWFLDSANEFRACALLPPQDSFWKSQLDQVASTMKQTTSEQKQRILFWAGMIAQDSSEWRDIAAKYMTKKNIPLKKQLQVRACLGSGLFDAMIATFDSKYTYWIKRPSMSPIIRAILQPTLLPVKRLL